MNRPRIFSAITSRNVDRVARCLQDGSDPNELESGATPLMLAAAMGLSEIVELLLARGADPFKVDFVGENALTDAARAEVDNEQIIQRLRGLGVRPTLDAAALLGDLAAVEDLITSGVDVNKCTRHGTTALMRAAERGHIGVVHALIKYGADTGALDEFGSALTHSVKHGQAAVAGALIELGADVNAPSSFGTPLSHAAQQGRLDIVGLLLAHGATVDTVDESGTTPLIEAATEGHSEVVESLLAAGADPSATNDFGIDAAEAARLKKHSGVERILRNAIRKAGAN